MKIIKITLLFMIMAGLYGCGKSPDVIKPGEYIKIGFLGPMTGDAGNYGKLISQAVNVAVEEFNVSGGVYGFKARMIIEDDEGRVEKGNPAIEKLAGVDRVFGIIGAVFSSVSLAVAPKAEASKIVMISPSSTHRDLPDKGDYIFRDVINDALQAVVFAKYLITVEKIKTTAVLYIKNEYSQGLAVDFKTQYEKDGGRIVAFESGLQGDKDFKTQLTKIKGMKPEALYIPNYVAECAQIIEQAKQLGFNVKIFSADGFSNPQILELAGELANGVIFTQAAQQPSGKVRKAFEAKYIIRYREKPDSFSLNGYDGAKIILNAVAKTAEKDAGGNLKIDRDKVREFVSKTTDWDGASGKITFTPNGDLVADIGINIVEKKQFRQIKVFRLDGDKIVEMK